MPIAHGVFVKIVTALGLHVDVMVVSTMVVSGLDRIAALDGSLGTDRTVETRR